MRLGSGMLQWMVVVAFAVGAVYFLLTHGAPQGADRAPAPRATMPSAPVLQAPSTGTAPVSRETAAPAPLAPDETVLCGHGRMTLDAANPIREKASKDADKVLAGVKAALARSKQPRDAALGFFMQQSTDALVAVAAGAADPKVLGLAFLACGYAQDGSCAALSVRQWTASEPENGVPWMLLAGDAGADKNARNDAVVRASNARYFDQHAPDFLAMLQWPELRDQPPQTHAALQDQLTVLQASLPTLLYMPLIQYCTDPSIERTVQSGVCGRLSATLLKDRTLFGFSTGIKLAELAGTPPEQVAALRQKRAAYQNALNAATTQRAQRSKSDCDDVAAFDRVAADYSRLGETGLATRLIDEASADADAAKLRR